MKVSAYIPCYNNEKTIKKCIESIQNQTIPVDELFVVDDASDDTSIKIIQSINIRVVKMKVNQGRGAVRNKAMKLARNEWVLSCDASLSLEKQFLEKAIHNIQEANIAAVYGRVITKSEKNAVERWKSTYLYRKGEFFGKVESSTFLSGGAVVRRSAVMKISNYNTLCKHSEDRDLGDRLYESGFKILSDDDMRMFCNRNDSLIKVYERYWRWNSGSEISLYLYIKNIYYSLKEMVLKDLIENDLPKAFISLILPHYIFFKSIIENKLELKKVDTI
jgi:glycosyltransferase involved in cell wall biosynthesis